MAASNDNPSPSGLLVSTGGGAVSEPQRAWAPNPGPKEQSAPSPKKDQMGGDAGSTGGAGPQRKPETLAREAEAARRDFHRAAAGDEASAKIGPQHRSAALQAFFVANAGRSLMPSGETSGVLSPSLKTEEP